ncbi:MAG: hypothetical protein R2850_06000 [Bacteroidia bacterium]
MHTKSDGYFSGTNNFNQVIYNANGQEVGSTCKRRITGSFSGGLAPAKRMRNRFEYISTDGSKAINETYQNALPFSDSYAWCKSMDGKGKD